MSIVVVLVALCAVSVRAAEPPQYDVLIRGGRVLDGTANPWRYADVAIKGDRIVAVGSIPATATAVQVVDAQGKVVTPGFIDPHSHAAPAIETARLAPAASILFQGITTIMINPDGGGPADLRSQVDSIRSHVPGVNVAPLIGHNAVREAVMNRDNREPTAGEQKRMDEHVRAAMEFGAFGLSSGPFYVPGKYAKTEEIVQLAKVAAQFPGAFYTSHIRDESDYDVGVLAAVDEVIRISREARLPGVVTHIKVLGPALWGKSREVIQHIDAARAAGIEVWADQYPYVASSTSMQAALVPGWAQEGGSKALIERLRNPQQRARIRQEMAKNLERRAGAGAIQIRSYAPDATREGKRLDAIARELKQDPLDTAIDMLLQGGAPIVSFNMDEQDIEAFMRQPWTMTCTDGGLVELGEGAEHPRAYGAFPRKMRRYALDRGIISLEQAVHSSTGLPAAVFGVVDRGELRPGAFADVLVFDPKTLSDIATYEKPHAYARGMDYVFVNGQAAIAAGALVAKRSGRVLLRSRTASPGA